jgi:FkbM family methyltransferase
MQRLKRFVNSSLGAVGLELRKLKSHHVDPYGDQQRLLAREQVRTVFDLGASHGDATEIYRALFPDATIHSFEPTEAPFELVRRRFAGDPKVVPVRAAVGAEDGEGSLFVNAFDQTNSLLPAAHANKALVGPEMANVAMQSVPVIALDSYCARHNIDRIDLLKMDIQGFELNALRGARQLLERQAVGLIFCEVLFGRHYEGQAFYHDLAGLLHPLGYELYGLYTLLRGGDGVLSHGDAIFTSRRVREQVLR